MNFIPKSFQGKRKEESNQRRRRSPPPPAAAAATAVAAMSAAEEDSSTSHARIHCLKYPDLQKECKKRSRKAIGKKEQLQNRLLGKEGTFLFLKTLIYDYSNIYTDNRCRCSAIIH